MLTRILAASIVLVAMFAVAPRTVAQEAPAGLTVFAVHIDRSQPTNGWQDVTVSLGFRNDGDRPVELSLPSNTQAMFAIAEGRTYPGTIGQSPFDSDYEDRYLRDFPLPPGMAFCGYWEDSLNLGLGYATTVAVGRIPEGTTLSQLAIPGFLAAADLSIAPDSGACQEHPKDSSDLSQPLVLGSESDSVHAAFGISVNVHTARMHVQVTNLNRFDDYDLGAVTAVVYENGVWGLPYFNQTICPQPDWMRSDNNPATLGPSQSNSYEACLPAVNAEPAAVVVWHPGAGVSVAATIGSESTPTSQ